MITKASIKRGITLSSTPKYFFWMSAQNKYVRNKDIQPFENNFNASHDFIFSAHPNIYSLTYYHEHPLLFGVS